VVPISNVFWGLSTVAVTFFFHIFLVSVVLGLSVIIPIYEITGYLKGDRYYISIARKLTSYLIRVDLFAGVMATWLTVFLGAYWPSLVYIATNVLLYPVSLAVAGIMIAIVSMALYWYTWDRMGRRAHIVVGLFMAAGALMVPFGMSSIISLMDYPYGVKVTTSLGLTFFTSNGKNPLMNPVFLPLALFAWFATIALTSFIVLYYVNSRAVRETGPAKNYIPVISAIISSVLSLLFLYLALSRLEQYSPYLWSALKSSSVLYILIALSLLVVLLSILSIHWKISKYSSLTGAVFSYFLFMLFEISSNVSRYPYMIVTGNTGITAQTFANPLYGIPVSIPIVGFAIIALMTVTFLFTLYLAFFVYPVEGGHHGNVDV
jgi:cytochrome d ubiquinol oxidase subunit I